MSATTIDPAIATLTAALGRATLDDRDGFERRHRHRGPDGLAGTTVALAGVSWMLAGVYRLECALEERDGRAVGHVVTHSFADGRSGETLRDLGLFDEGCDDRLTALLAELGAAIGADLAAAGRSASAWKVAVHLSG